MCFAGLSAAFATNTPGLGRRYDQWSYAAAFFFFAASNFINALRYSLAFMRISDVERRFVIWYKMQFFFWKMSDDSNRFFQSLHAAFQCFRAFCTGVNDETYFASRDRAFIGFDRLFNAKNGRKRRDGIHP